jgi:large subunit ribosomal protein L4
MKTLTVPVYNQNGKQLKKITLDKSVFDGHVNQSALYQAVLAYRANQRKGLAATKTRGEVSGGGVKPWRQKGTGRARVGSSRNPLWRGGGVVFGPHPRGFGFTLPKKIGITALKSSLNAKMNENNLLILEDLKIGSPKTKEAALILSNLKLENQAVLLMLDEIGTNLKRSFRNISFSEIIAASNAGAYDVLRARKLIVNLKGLNILINRIKSRIKPVSAKPIVHKVKGKTEAKS